MEEQTFQLQKELFLKLKLSVYEELTKAESEKARKLLEEMQRVCSKMMPNLTPVERLRFQNDLDKIRNTLKTIPETPPLQKKPEEHLPKRIHERIIYPPGEEEKYTTDFDKILEIIVDKGKMNIGDMSLMFKISKKKAEEWSQILADRKLVTLHYLAVGGVEIRRRDEVAED